MSKQKDECARTSQSQRGKGGNPPSQKEREEFKMQVGKDNQLEMAFAPANQRELPF